MSIFDPTSGMNPIEWLKEKSLSTLETAVKLVDLANEPDTTTWYKKNLKRIAEHLIARLVPMTGLLHQVPSEGVTPEEWQAIVEGGTFALTKWCRKWEVANPYHFSNSLAAKERDESEKIEKSQPFRTEVQSDDNEYGNDLKLNIYSHYALQMLQDDLTVHSKRLLSWALFHLYTSKYADIVLLEKDFLPTDIGCTSEETSEGYRLLYEKGLIEKVEGLDIMDRFIAIRLVVYGLNDSKHPTVFQEETFGKPGLRIDGKATIGNIFYITFDSVTNKYLEWFAQSEDFLQPLHDFLQKSIGHKYVYIENVSVVSHKQTKESAALEIKVRYPIEYNDSIVENLLTIHAKQWLSKSRVAGLKSV